MPLRRTEHRRQAIIKMDLKKWDIEWTHPSQETPGFDLSQNNNESLVAIKGGTIFVQLNDYKLLKKRNFLHQGNLSFAQWFPNLWVYDGIRQTQHKANLRSLAEICDFGSDNDLNTCDWNNRNGSTLQWQNGSGSLSNWLGGPSRDSGAGDDALKGNNNNIPKVTHPPVHITLHTASFYVASDTITVFTTVQQ